MLKNTALIDNLDKMIQNLNDGILQIISDDKFKDERDTSTQTSETPNKKHHL